MCHRCFHWIRWCQPLKDKKAKTVLYGFNEIVEESKGQPNKLWVDHGREFYNSPMQKWLHDNDILMYLTHNEGKSVVAEKFIKKLKDKIYKTMTANDSKSYLNYLNKLIDEYSNTYHRSVGKKPIDADYSALTDKIESNCKAPKFKIDDRVRITN